MIVNDVFVRKSCFILRITDHQLYCSKRCSKMAKPTDISQFLIPNEVPFNFLECKKAFDGLTAREKSYAHHICKASWQGALICLLQTSPESPGIFLLFQKIFSTESVESFSTAAQQGENGLSEVELKVC